MGPACAPGSAEQTWLLAQIASFRVIRTRFGLILPGKPVRIIPEPDLAL